QRLNLPLNHTFHGVRPRGGPHNKRHARRIILFERRVCHRLRLFTDEDVFRISNDPDNHALLRVAEKPESLTQCLLVRPKTSSHCLVYDDHFLLSFAICIGETSTTHQRHANRFEVTSPDHVRVNEYARIRLDVLLTFREDAALEWWIQRQCGCDTSRCHARQRADPIYHLTMIFLASAFIVVVQRYVVWNCYEVFALKPKIESLRIREAPNEQTCRCQRDDRQHHLREYQKISPLVTSCASATKAFLQVCREIGAGCAYCRRDAEKYSAHNGKGERKHEYCCIDRHIQVGRVDCSRQKRNDQIAASDPDRDRQQATWQGNDQTLN